MEEDDGEADLGGSSFEQSNLGNWFFGGYHTYRLVKSVLLSISNLGLHQICCCAHTPSMDMSHYYHQEENRFRGAAHAGSWYTSNGKTISLVKSEREGGDYSS